MKEADRERYRLRSECIDKNKKPKKQSSDNGTMVNRPVTEHLVSQSPLSLSLSLSLNLPPFHLHSEYKL
jgi:hypothetical protein